MCRTRTYKLKVVATLTVFGLFVVLQPLLTTQVYKRSSELENHHDAKSDGSWAPIDDKVKPSKKSGTLSADLSLEPFNPKRAKRLRRPRGPDIASERRNVTKVLIAAYYRTGSSLVGKMFEYQHNSFYWFEPLKGLYNRYRTKYRLPRNPMLNGYRFKGRRRDNYTDVLHKLALESMESLYQCNMNALPHAILDDNFLRTASSDKVEEYKRCMYLYRGKASTRSIHSINDCLPSLIQGCEGAKLRTAKVIRLSLRLVYKLMEVDPYLKVIHLVRDPRGILQSRNSIVPYTLSTFSRDIDITCDCLRQDIDFFPDVQKKFPRRIVQVKFEDVALDPVKAATDIYSFVGIKMTEPIRKWLVETTNADHENHALGVIRNATVVVNKWKNFFNKWNLQAIEDGCEDVMKHFSYEPSTDEKLEIGNMGVPAWGIRD